MSDMHMMPMAVGTRRLQIWRGDLTSGELVDYDLETEPGMVVLDAVLEIQRSQAPDLAVRWNCKAAKCGSCSAEINGKPRLMCKTRLDHLPAGRADHGRADEGVPGDPRPGHRRLVELPRQRADHAVHAARGPQGGRRPQERRLPDRPGRHRPHERVPQVHRVLHVPGRLPHPARPPHAQPLLRAALHAPHGKPRHASARRRRPPRPDRRRGRHRPLQHHQVLHRGLPRGHPHHRQRDHPDEGARRRHARSVPQGSRSHAEQGRGSSRRRGRATQRCNSLGPALLWPGGRVPHQTVTIAA